MGSHGLMGKSVWYEESMVIPLMIRWPGKITPGTDDLLIGTADLTASLLALTGQADQIPSEMQGNNYAPAFLGETIERPTSALYIESVPSWPEGGKRGVRTHQHTYVVERSKDGGDREILHDNQREVAEGLRVEMDGWLRETEDPWVLR
jgi:arylsulfatase A-like enzyme